MSFRLMIFTACRARGLPQHFSSWGEYRRHTDILVETASLPHLALLVDAAA